MGPVLWTEDVPGTTVERPTGSVDPSAGWLDGDLVVDLTNVIAGPTIGSTLARYGARVVKVDLPQPTFDPWNTVLCGLHSNRGKESVLLDAGLPAGREALSRLLARADVLTVNASEQQLARLGLTGADLAALAPRAVLCHLDAWGGPDGGPWRQRSGYDDLVQAATGIMSRFGGGLDTPEEHAHFGTIDVLAGLAAAAATAFALYARDSTGRAPIARSSLAAAGQLIQAAYLVAHTGPRPTEPSGRAAKGEGPTYRVYATGDGWVFVVVPPERLVDLGRVIGVETITALSVDDLAEVLSEALGARPTAYWQARLAPLGITVQPLRTLAHQRDLHGTTQRAPWSASSYHFTTVADHAVGRAVTLVAPVAVRPATARIVVPTDAPQYGEHTAAGPAASWATVRTRSPSWYASVSPACLGPTSTSRLKGLKTQAAHRHRPRHPDRQQAPWRPRGQQRQELNLPARQGRSQLTEDAVPDERLALIRTDHHRTELRHLLQHRRHEGRLADARFSRNDHQLSTTATGRLSRVDEKTRPTERRGSVPSGWRETHEPPLSRVRKSRAYPVQPRRLCRGLRRSASGFSHVDDI